MTTTPLATPESGRLRTALLTAGFCLCMLPFALFSGYLFFYTSTLDPALYQIEHILYRPNALWAQALGILAFFSLLWLARRYLGQRPVGRLEKALLGYVFFAGLAWVFMAAVIPHTETTDAGICTDIAALLLQGAALPERYVEYVQVYPFQTGYIFYSALLQWIFGAHAFTAIGAMNAAALAFAYAAILRISRQCFNDDGVQRSVVLLLLCLVQPILFCTFHYGNLPGLALATWGMAYCTRFLKNQGKRIGDFFAAALLCAGACILKLNTLICACAMAIQLLLWGGGALSSARGARFRRFVKATLSAAVLLVLVIGLKSVPQWLFQRTTGIPLGRGMPQEAMMAMGMQDSGSAPGWWNGYNTRIMKENDLNTGDTALAAMKSVKVRATYFRDNPSIGATFFLQKLVSQWCEPTFESVWVSKRMERSTTELSRVAAGVYDGWLGTALEGWMRIDLWYVYVLFTAGMALSVRDLRKKKAEPLGVALRFLLPLTVLGGVAYHLLFEAKSQYALSYLPMMIPLAGYGITALFRALDGRLRR